MPILSCPHCSAAIAIPDGESDTDMCPKLGCGAIMERHTDERDAHDAIRRAVYSIDLTAEKQAADASFRNALGKAFTAGRL